jgi:hypothetical protein
MPAQPPQRRFLTRRRFLVTSAGAALAVVAGTGVYHGATPWVVRRWVMDAVRKNLPGVPLDEPSLAQFAHDALESPELLRSTRRRVLVWAGCTAPALVRRVDGAQRPLDILERRVLSHFLIASDFFPAREDRSEPVIYTGLVAACGNVFARYHES